MATIEDAASQLYDEVFEQIEAGALDDVADDTYPGGWEALADADAAASDSHQEATVRAVLTALAAKLTERANGNVTPS